MKRPPTLRELLEAKEREHLAAAAAMRNAIDRLDVELDGDIAPRGCDLFVEGVACSPYRHTRVCVEDGCGEIFVRCSMHGGAFWAADDLQKHLWAIHQTDDKERRGKPR